MNRAKAIFGLFVFALGLAVGAVAAQFANPAPPESPWRALPAVDEPAAAAQVSRMLVSDDATGLARSMDIHFRTESNGTCATRAMVGSMSSR